MSPLINGPGSSPDDPQILETVRIVAVQFGFPDFSVKGVRWLNNRGGGKGGHIVFSDLPVFQFHDLIIRRDMMGRLSPEEWRPLIAAALVYHKRKLPKLRLKAIEIIGIPFLLAIGASFVVLDITHSGLAASPFIFGSLGLIFLGLIRYSKHDAEAGLQADLEAAKIIGKESLLGTLQKIAGLGMADLELRRKPSINDRITNLLQLQ
jgi:hypothetical protein